MSCGHSTLPQKCSPLKSLSSIWGLEVQCVPFPWKDLGWDCFHLLPCVPSAHFLALCAGFTMISLLHVYANFRAALWKPWLPSLLANTPWSAKERWGSPGTGSEQGEQGPRVTCLKRDLASSKNIDRVSCFLPGKLTRTPPAHAARALTVCVPCSLDTGCQSTEGREVKACSSSPGH